MENRRTLVVNLTGGTALDKATMEVQRLCGGTKREAWWEGRDVSEMGTSRAQTGGQCYGLGTGGQFNAAGLH